MSRTPASSDAPQTSGALSPTDSLELAQSLDAAQPDGLDDPADTPGATQTHEHSIIQDLLGRLTASPAQRLEAPSFFDYRRNALSETIVTTVVALLVLVLLYSLISEQGSPLITSIALAGLVAVAFATIRQTLSPDRLRAQQTKRTLNLASRTLVYMRGGLTAENSQAVCEILLPESQAMAVAMTNDQVVLGYAGEHAEAFPIGSTIHTAATHRVLESQQIEVFSSSGAIGMRKPTASEKAALKSKRKLTPAMKEALEAAQAHVWHEGDLDVEIGQPSTSIIPAGIVAPLVVRGVSVGTLKLYYEAPHLIDETQRAIAEGLAELLSTQLSMSELDRQVELATKAELQALQSQINPHFLFNTINTIASLIRTDPMRARGLLREFAVFYRQTLENSNDLIPLDREIQQTNRYLGFEVARFGDERIATTVDLGQDLADLRVPSFIIQPIVENAVNHAMRPEGTLHIAIDAQVQGADVLIRVSDDGVGMTPEQAKRLIDEAGPSKRGTGIALRNVDGRLRAVFAPGSHVEVVSQPGEGTVVTLHLLGAAPASDVAN